MPPERSDLCNPVRLDLTNVCLWRGAQRIPLRPKTFAVLRCLLAHRGQLVTKAALLDAVWPETTVNDVALMICIRELRQALGDDPRAPQFIETLHRRGYRFVGDLPVTAQPSCSPPSAVHNSALPVGRQAELTRLHAWLATALCGVRQVVFVTGEAGLGKTALVEAFMAELGTYGPLWLGQGQCVEHYGAGEAYLPVLEALGRLCRGPGGKEVVALLEQQAPTWLVQMPGLVRAADLETLRRRLVGATRDRMLRELAEALDLLTTRQPLLLVLEDLHWSDYSTLDLLAVLARRREASRLLLLGTYRLPDALQRGHPLHTVHHELQRHGQCAELPLPLLPEAAVADYLATRFPDARLPARLARLVHQRTEGNPLFMVTVVEEWVRRGWLVQGDRGWTLRVELAALTSTVPEGLRQMLEQQLERLSPMDQRVLEVGSVAGATFSAAAVAAGLGHEVVEVEEWCAGLARRRQWLEACGEQVWPDGTVAGRYRFTHALYQEVAYQRLTAVRRAQLHRRIGEREEAGYGLQVREQAAVLAGHFTRGRDTQRAVRYLQLAGQQALQQLAYAEAISHVTAAVELLETLPDTVERAQRELALQLTLARAIGDTQGLGAPAVGRAYARARALCQQVGEPPQHFTVLGGLGQFYIQHGKYQTAHALAEQLLSLAQRQRDPAHLVNGYRRLGQSFFYLGALSAARAHLEQAIALASPQRHPTVDRSGGRDYDVHARNIVAEVLWLLGYPEQARERSHEALTLARERANPNTLANTLAWAAGLHQHRREGPLAQEQAEACITLATGYGSVAYATQGTIMRGWALAAQGQGQEGIAQLRQGLAARRAAESVVGWSYYLSLLAEAYGHVGQTAAGLSAIAEALAFVHTTGERIWEAELYRLQGELLSLGQEEQERGRVEECFRQALEVARYQQAKSLELRAAMSLARLWQRQGKRQEAYDLLAPLYGWFTEGFDTADLQETKALLTELADIRGNSGRAAGYA
jgi:predicted ATPase